MKKIIFILFFLLILVFSGCQKKNSSYNKIEEKPSVKMSGEIIKLPEPKLEGKMSLEEAIVKRRSIREFSDTPLTKEEISQILWAAQGITDKEKGFRSAPSAGALYPLEIFLVVGENGVEDISPGVYQFLPEEHSLKVILEKDVKEDLANAALGQSAVGEAAVDVVITAEFERTTGKYGERGTQYVWLEAGHVAENILLQVVSLNLGAVPIGAFGDDSVVEILDIPSDFKPLYIIPVGKPKE